MIAGALWVGLMLAATGAVPAPPAPLVPPAANAPAETTAGGAPGPGLVAVGAPPADDAVLVEASTRIRAELAASGIASTEIDCLPGSQADGAGCPPAAATATISLGRENGVAVIDVVLTLPGGPELRRRVPVYSRDGGDDPAVLAVRAVELLRDLRPSARRPAPVGPASDDEEPKQYAPEPPPAPPRLWRLALGAAALASLQRPNVGPAPGIALSAGYLLRPRMSVFLTVAGPFSDTIRPRSDESATVTQGLATLELRYRFELGGVQPFGAVLTGIDYVRDAFTFPLTPTQQASGVDSTFVAAVGGAGGITFQYWDRFTATIEAQAFVTSREVLADAGQDLAGGVGRPSVLLLANAGLVLP